MKKNTYIKPKVIFTIIQVGCAIAEGSIHIGPSTENFIPNVDDFNDSFPVIEGQGDV